MKRILSALLRTVAALLLLALLVLTVFSVSPIYRFGDPEPFSGPDIYNPYEGFSGEWKKSCFHTHSRVSGPLNECRLPADSVISDYRKLGYDIVGISNHNTVTRNPLDSTIRIYEHGYSLFKFHKLVFNPSRVRLWDHILPFMVSQKQWQYDLLTSNADFIVMNHPDRTLFTTPRTMRLLSGYRLIEADCADSDCLKWDDALSAGHYCHNLSSDDCHDTRDSRKVGRRCSWLDTPTSHYEDIAPALLQGRFYSMRIPDLGSGDWQAKYSGHKNLPGITDIGVRGDTVYVRLSEPARIEARGRGHILLGEVQSDALKLILPENEPYVRFTAFFDNEVTLFTNAFARYDASAADSPFVAGDHKVNVLLTVLWNALLLALAILFLCWLKAVLPHKKKESRPTVEQLRFRGIVP